MSAQFDGLLSDFIKQTGLPLDLEAEVGEVVFDVDEKYTLKIALNEDESCVGISCQLRNRQLTSAEKDLLLRINVSANDGNGIFAGTNFPGDELVLMSSQRLEGLNTQMLLDYVENLVYASDALSGPLFKEIHTDEAKPEEANMRRV